MGRERWLVPQPLGRRSRAVEVEVVTDFHKGRREEVMFRVRQQVAPSTAGNNHITAWRLTKRFTTRESPDNALDHHGQVQPHHNPPALAARGLN
jgi:hypothetical protein